MAKNANFLKKLQFQSRGPDYTNHITKELSQVNILFTYLSIKSNPKDPESLINSNISDFAYNGESYIKEWEDKLDTELFLKTINGDKNILMLRMIIKVFFHTYQLRIIFYILDDLLSEKSLFYFVDNEMIILSSDISSILKS